MKDEERNALDRIEREVADAGATFTYPIAERVRPSTVLGILRRDGFSCRACGGRDGLIIGGLGRGFDGLHVVCSGCTLVE